MSKSFSDLIAVTMGDPMGIGPEVIAKALPGQELPHRTKVIIIGDSRIASAAFERWGKEKVPLLRSLDEANHIGESVAIWQPLASHPAEEAPEATWIRIAAEGCLSKFFEAMVTGPICKEKLYSMGFPFPGHTEYLAHLTGVTEPVMAFVSPRLKVSLATVHLPLADVARSLTPDAVLNAITKSAEALKRQFGIPKPRLAVCGLNPHAGEDGHLGKEEILCISPAIKSAISLGIDVSGPLPADAAFALASSSHRYDLVVAMYHDQGLIPIKALNFFDSVNVTFGLPIIRTSVDHGVAYDIAGQGVADAGSMRAAIAQALAMASSHACTTNSL